MRPSEAKAIGYILAQLDQGAISPFLNLGSSTAAFRSVAQPHIEEYIFKPLAERGVDGKHADLKSAPGVDISGDIYDPAVATRLKELSPRLILCCNMFEHVTDRGAMASNIESILEPGGYLLVTVPFSYPIHHDPIDTYFRPSPEELAKLFPKLDFVKATIQPDTSYLEDLVREHGWKGTAAHLAKSVVKLFMFWRGLKWWTAHFHRYLWLWRPYKTTIVLMRARLA